MTTENLNPVLKYSDIVYVVSIGSEEIYKDWTKKALKGKAVIEVRNDEASSIFSKYNLAISKITDIDKKIVVFVHEDIRFVDISRAEREIVNNFNKNKKVGILGVYGVDQYTENGGWWLCNRSQHAFGRIIQGLPDGRFFIMSDRPETYKDDLVMIDGCFMAIRGELLNRNKFNEEMTGYHFYDVSYCISTLENTEYNIAVDTSIEVIHKSEGPISPSWFKTKENYISKLKTKYQFPIYVNTIRKQYGNI